MKISSRDKIFLIAGAIAVCLFLIIKFIVFPFYDKVTDQKNDVQLKERTLEKSLKFIQKQAKLQQTLKRLTREKRSAQRSLLKGATPSLAAADIQKIVDKISEASSVDVNSVRVLDPGEKDGFVTIPIQVKFTSDLSRMKKFINDIENHRKLLTISELKIRVKNKRKPRKISVTLEISGFMKKK